MVSIILGKQPILRGINEFVYMDKACSVSLDISNTFGRIYLGSLLYMLKYNGDYG